MLELLAPAGSREALEAAVQNGADAVYLGFGDFNARRNAKNFTEADFASAVSYCHLRGVKVYLTLNTLLTDRELPLADKLFLEEERIIEEAAAKGNCVIVGRASGYILREHVNALRVFVYADKQKRIQRAIEREGIQQSEAENALKRNDKRRGGFYSSVTNWRTGILRPVFERRRTRN